MNDKKDKFYFQGKFFDDKKEFWEYVDQWPEIELNQEILDEMMNSLKKEIMKNVFMYDRKITNGQMNSILENVFINIIKELNQLNK